VRFLGYKPCALSTFNPTLLETKNDINILNPLPNPPPISPTSTLPPHLPPPLRTPPHLVLHPSNKEPVLLQKPPLRLPAARVPGRTRIHARARAARAPAHEPVVREVDAERVFVEEGWGAG
jgi:hypothetical protein